MKIYVASSWRNTLQPVVVGKLRSCGHEVYDFKDPSSSFSWKDTQGTPPESWSRAEYLQALKHPLARKGFFFDMNALRTSDATVLVLPCGRSAHLELGYAVGAKQNTIVYIPNEDFEPELMYLACSEICTSLEDVVKVLDR